MTSKPLFLQNIAIEQIQSITNTKSPEIDNLKKLAQELKLRHIALVDKAQKKLESSTLRDKYFKE